MKIIGITGGVGAGKTRILNYIQEHYACRVIYADIAAHEVEKRGTGCYRKLVKLLGRDVLGEDLEIDKQRMAQKIFADAALLAKVNAIVHPAVKKYILKEIAVEKKSGKNDYFFIEAALLIEERYDLICDELWYIYADRETRRQRLSDARGYSREKTDAIMDAQLDEDTYRASCQVVIDNSRAPEDAFSQVDRQLGGWSRGLE